MTEVTQLTVGEVTVPNGATCEIITERNSDGIHDKTCGLTADIVVSDGSETILCCDTHSDSLLRYVGQTSSVPAYFSRLGSTPIDPQRVNIKGGYGDCNCEACTND